MREIRRAGGDWPRSLCHLRRRTTAATRSPLNDHHLQKHKWFSFAFNGQLANYTHLRDKLLAENDHHLARMNDTEIMMHEISRELSGDRRLPLIDVMRHLATRFDGAYTLALLNAQGEMLVARDPVGDQADVLCHRGPIVCGGKRERSVSESGFPS